MPDPPREAYEDEVVATENYYRKEDVDPLRLTLIEDEQNLHSETVGETAPRADPPECEETDAQPDPDETDAFRRTQTKLRDTDTTRPCETNWKGSSPNIPPKSSSSEASKEAASSK